MDKKRLLLSILEELFGIFDAAQELHAYVGSSQFDESEIDGLLALFEDEIEKVSDSGRYDRLVSRIGMLKELQVREMSEAEKESSVANETLERSLQCL